MGNIRTQIGKIVGKSLNDYHQRVKPKVDDLKFKEEYQGRIIDCMVGEVDDNYIETPETDENVVKLEYSKEGVVKIPRIKGKTILIDADGNETDTPGEGCKLVSVGEDEDNKLIILSNNKNLFNGNYTFDKWDNKVTEYIYIKGLTSISHSTTSMDDGALISTSRFYDKNKNLIKDNGNTWNNRKLDIPNGAEYIQHSIKPTVDINTFMVESGSIITNYVPHQSHKTEILLNEPLRKYDYMLDNKIYRKCKNLQIEPNFEIYSQQIWNDYYGVYMGINGDFSEIAPSRISEGTVYFSRFIINYNRWDIVSDYGIQAMNMYMLSSNLSKYLQLFCKIPKNEVELYNGTIDEKIQQWFNDNAPKLDIIYEIENPIIEELPNSITLQGFDDTTMYIENSITPTVSYGYNALIPYKEELSNQKEEVETNTLDIENNIIPYLMDMEYNLMLMEDE